MHLTTYTFIFLCGLGLLMQSSATLAPDDFPPTASESATTPLVCAETGSVLMVVTGTTLDRERMQTYSKAIKDAGLYPQTLGYYLNDPRPLRTFEGDLDADFATLIVRFPSECAAIDFWYSKVYQNEIKPLRENPSAGEYRVTLYRDLPLPDYMFGKVSAANYLDSVPD